MRVPRVEEPLDTKRTAYDLSYVLRLVNQNRHAAQGVSTVSAPSALPEE